MPLLNSALICASLNSKDSSTVCVCWPCAGLGDPGGRGCRHSAKVRGVGEEQGRSSCCRGPSGSDSLCRARLRISSSERSVLELDPQGQAYVFAARTRWAERRSATSQMWSWRLWPDKPPSRAWARRTHQILRRFHKSCRPIYRYAEATAGETLTGNRS